LSTLTEPSAWDVGAGRRQVGTVRGGRHSLVLGELATVRTTQVNTLMMLAVALVFTYTMASRGLIIPMTMAFVVVNTPLNTYFSRYLSTRAVVMAAPGSRRVFAAHPPDPTPQGAGDDYVATVLPQHRDERAYLGNGDTQEMEAIVVDDTDEPTPEDDAR